MGADQSSEAGMPMGGSFNRPIQSDVYMPFNGTRSSIERQTAFVLEPQQQETHKVSQKVIKSAFNGIWSTITSDKIGPQSRTGHFTIRDLEGRCVYIGDGMSENGETIFDLWKLDLDSLEWSPVVLHGDDISPRTGARAVLCQGLIIVFGGFSDPDYFADLHVIKPETGEVKFINAKGDLPIARSSPIMEYVNGKIYLWGGFNGNWINDLNVLDMQTLEWRLYPQNISGRTNVPSVVFKNYIISYGGSKTGGLLAINTDTNVVSIVQTTGPQPPSQSMGSGMVLIDEHILFFGGKTNFQGSLIYACNLTKQWWFVFHILPDGETVSLEDGSITDVGLFMIPNIHSFSAVYDPKNRTILAFLGEPFSMASVIQKFDIADALAYINLREDMITALDPPQI